MPILAIYDLRGIQSFIFRTNRLKEIIGASEIIRTLLENALSAFSKQNEEPVITDWKNTPFTFLQENLAGEVLYSGGGNLLVIWKDAEITRKAGRFMSQYMLEHAYSVGLSYATTPVTDSFQSDYRQLCENLDRIKNMQSNALPLPCVPFSVLEEGTGLPAVYRADARRISTETILKLNAAKPIYKKDSPFTLQIDDITSTDGKNFVAIVHADGNSMGAMIRDCMVGNQNYTDAVTTMRTLSQRITNSFSEACSVAFHQQAETLGLEKNLPFRPVICAGDDITFICRADLAFSITEKLLNEISRQTMRDDAKGNPDFNFCFSACAGIAFVRAHYPFSRAYELAEELCAKAKEKARNETKTGRSGSYLDFHIVQSGVSNSLKQIRKREYVNSEGYSLLLRPLCCDDSQRTDSAALLHERIDEMQKLPRIWIKQARNAYQISEYEVCSVFRRAGIHHAEQTQTVKVFDENHRALYFDALEIMDMIIQRREDTP